MVNSCNSLQVINWVVPKDLIRGAEFKILSLLDFFIYVIFGLGTKSYHVSQKTPVNSGVISFSLTGVISGTRCYDQ